MECKFGFQLRNCNFQPICILKRKCQDHEFSAYCSANYSQRFFYLSSRAVLSSKACCGTRVEPQWHGRLLQVPFAIYAREVCKGCTLWHAKLVPPHKFVRVVLHHRAYCNQQVQVGILRPHCSPQRHYLPSVIPQGHRFGLVIMCQQCPLQSRGRDETDRRNLY